MKIKSFFTSLFTPGILISALICSAATAWSARSRWTIIWMNGQYFDGQLLTTKILMLGSFIVALLPFFILFLALAKKIYFFLFVESVTGDLTQATKETRTASQNPYKLLMILGIGIGVIFYINNIRTQIDTLNWTYQPFQVVENRIQPVGIDFRTGLYRPAESLLSNFDLYAGPVDGIYNNYPPVVYVLSIPFLIINENDAYLLQTMLLYAAMLGSIALAIVISKKIFLPDNNLNPEKGNVISVALFFLISFYAITSYPFLFAVERGNYDLFAIFLVLLFLWVLITRPSNVWLQVLLLSIAFQLKLYPGILFLIPLFKHGKKSILPLIALNVGLFLILGPVNAWGFIRTILQSAEKGSPWIGNHSAASFTNGLVSNFPQLASAESILLVLFSLLPVLLWLIGSIVLARRGIIGKSYLLYTMLSIPVMDLLPSISHDYKLVILFPAVVFLLMWMFSQSTQQNKRVTIVQTCILLVLLLFIARPYGTELPSRYLLNNKYLSVLALQGLMLWAVLTRSKPVRPAEPTQPGLLEEDTIR